MKAVRQWEADFLQFARDKHSSLLSDLESSPELTDELTDRIKACIDEFKSGYKPVESDT